MKICGIYEIRNKVTGKTYVGSSMNIRTRWAGHRCELKRGDHHSVALQRAWDKYGSESFEWNVLATIEDLDERLAEETRLITERGSANGKDGYNCLPVAGSPLGFSPSEETRKKMSEAQSKIPYEVRLKYCRSFTGRTHTEETKAKMSANSKRTSPSAEQRAAISAVHKGKTISAAHRAAVGKATALKNRTPEMREKVSKALKGRVMTPEHRAKLAESRKGYVTSPETKAKIAAAHKGRTFTPEHLAKIAATKAAKKLAASQALFQHVAIYADSTHLTEVTVICDDLGIPA